MSENYHPFSPHGRQVVKSWRIVFQCASPEASRELAVALNEAVARISTQMPNQIQLEEV